MVDIHLDLSSEGLLSFRCGISVLRISHEMQLHVSDVFTNRYINGRNIIHILDASICAIIVKDSDHGERLLADSNMHRGIASAVSRIWTRTVLQQDFHVPWVIRKDSEVKGTCSVVVVADLIWRHLAFLKQELKCFVSVLSSSHMDEPVSPSLQIKKG